MITAGISDAQANKVWTGLRKKFGNNITEHDGPRILKLDKITESRS